MAIRAPDGANKYIMDAFFHVPLKLLLQGRIELTMLAFNTFSFWRHPRSLVMHALKVPLQFVVASQYLLAHRTRNLLHAL